MVDDDRKFFEDFEEGDEFEFGSHTVTTAEIIEFAERYDPQPFHVDEQAAKESMFGELVASGWHTAAVCQRLFVEGLLEGLASAGGTGVDELRWHRPVTPGDELSIRATLREKRPSETFPTMGDVRIDIEGSNQDGEVVVSWTLLGLVQRRTTD